MVYTNPIPSSPNNIAVIKKPAMGVVIEDSSSSSGAGLVALGCSTVMTTLLSEGLLSVNVGAMTLSGILIFGLGAVWAWLLLTFLKGGCKIHTKVMKVMTMLATDITQMVDDARSYILSGPVASYEKHGFGLWLVEVSESGAPAGASVACSSETRWTTQSWATPSCRSIGLNATHSNRRRPLWLTRAKNSG